MNPRNARRALLAFVALSLSAGAAAAVVGAKSPSADFVVSANPSALSAEQGRQAQDTIKVAAKNGFSHTVALAVSGLPSGASVSLTNNPNHLTAQSVLTVFTHPATRTGHYSLRITGTSGTLEHTVTVVLSVTKAATVSTGHGRALTIAGAVDRALSPGVTGYLDLALANPDNHPLRVTKLAVAITGTSRSGCTASANFSTVQFSGSYPLSLPAKSTRTLSQLGVPRSQWPRLTMIDLPTNQDSCKNTALTLGYTGTGIGN